MTRPNTYVIQLDVELTHPLYEEHAKAAGDLMATDICQWFQSEGWGYGAIRVKSVYYSPAAQFDGDFVPEAQHGA